MAEGIAFAHAHGVKVYVTANILAHNGDLEGAAVYFEELKNMKPSGPKQPEAVQPIPTTNIFPGVMKSSPDIMRGEI